MGIDILPAELPVESSEHFSNALYPFVKEMVQGEVKPSLDKLSPLMRNATIADNGKLTSAHESLNKMLPTVSNTTSHGSEKKTVLLLGSGMVAAPLVEHLLARPDVKIVVGKVHM